MMTMPLDELRALLARHARPDLSTDIDAVRIFRADRPTPPTPTTYSKVLAVVAQGVKRFALGDRVYEHRAGEYVIASVDLPVTAQFLRASPEEPALGFGLDLRPAARGPGRAGAGARRVAGAAPPAPAGPLPELAPGATAGLAVSTASAELLDAVVRLLRLLDQPRDIPVLAPLIKREIIWRLLTGEQSTV